MDERQIRDLLDSVRSGSVAVDEAIVQLRDLPYEDLGFARVDHHRALRTGVPEVIYCPGKTTDHIIEIAGRIHARGGRVLATRAGAEVAAGVGARYPGTIYHEQARIVVVPEADGASARPTEVGSVLVVSAGTADVPVAEEAVVTASELGSRVERLYDVGVAGLHRLLDQRGRLDAANVIVVVAGMEGALASVVGGLVRKPVVAVPTSIGYGASFDGLAALLAMLNSCAAGVAVMNIDNGFGAGYFAHMVNSRTSDRAPDHA